jgi:hypothetical protein
MKTFIWFIQRNMMHHFFGEVWRTANTEKEIKYAVNPTTVFGLLYILYDNFKISELYEVNGVDLSPRPFVGPFAMTTFG